jgi:hypothetical protein
VIKDCHLAEAFKNQGLKMTKIFVGLAALMFYIVLVVTRPYDEKIHVRCTDKQDGQQFHVSLGVYAPYIWWAKAEGSGWIRFGDDFLKSVEVTTANSVSLVGLSEEIKFGFDKVAWSAWVVSGDKKQSGLCVSL